MRPHGDGMDARIGAAGGMHGDLFAGDCLRRFFDRLLHAWAVRLALETHERAAIEFQREREASHFRTVPIATGCPRRKSPASIAGLPAR